MRRGTKFESLFLDKGGKKEEFGEGGWQFFSPLSFFWLISYLWIYLDSGECGSANFKHYLILQTNLLMLVRSEEPREAVAK